MYILHIETSTKICSVALSYRDTLIGSLEMMEGMNHTALLIPSIDELLSANSVKSVDLAAISISSGPGSYTGLRVGSSTAKAMAYSLQIPILAIPTLSSLAKIALDQYPEADLAMPMIDARRNEVYTALIDRDLKNIAPVSSLILTTEGLSKFLPSDKLVVCCGDGSAKLASIPCDLNIIRAPMIRCSAVHLIGLANKMLGSGITSDPLHFVPFYLKPPNITEPRKTF